MRNSARKIPVSTSSYKAAHGKAPRGYGLWAFIPTGLHLGDDVLWQHGSYGAAKKQAQIVADACGYRSLKVGS